MKGADNPPELDAERLLASLAHDGVEFVVIGGFAVIAHGVIRATKDVDVIVRPEKANYQRLSLCLTEGSLKGSQFLWDSGWLDVNLADEAGLASATVFRIATPYGWLDVLNRVAGAPLYDDLVDDAVSATVAGERVRIASRTHLEAMKLAADRPRDRLDIGELRALERLEQDPGDPTS